MSFSITEPSNRQKWIAGILVIGYAILTLIPLIWIIATGFKTPSDAIAYPPKVLFSPSLEGYVNLFTSRTRLPPEDLAALGEPTTWYDRIVRSYDMVITGPSTLWRAVHEFGRDRLWVDLPVGVPWHHRGLCVQPFQGAAEG